MMMRLSPFNLPLDSFAAKQPGLADSCQNAVSILPLCLPSFYRSLYTYKFTTEDPAVQFQEEIIFFTEWFKVPLTPHHLFYELCHLALYHTFVSSPPLQLTFSKFIFIFLLHYLLNLFILCLGRAKSILHKNTSCIICILIEFHIYRYKRLGRECLQHARDSHVIKLITCALCPCKLSNSL